MHDPAAAGAEAAVLGDDRVRRRAAGGRGNGRESRDEREDGCDGGDDGAHGGLFCWFKVEAMIGHWGYLFCSY